MIVVGDGVILPTRPSKRQELSQMFPVPLGKRIRHLPGTAAGGRGRKEKAYES